MKTLRLIPSMVLLMTLSTGSAPAQQRAKISDNAALRYWSAFAQMQDSAITDQQAKELNTILDGAAPYDDLKYKDLVEKNRLALEIVARATALSNCDWGLDYQLGADVPVDYARKALALGRLNVLYAFHLLIAGDKDATVSTLAAGMHFSRDVANGGSLFAALVAKNLLTAHLRAVAFALQMGSLSSPQRSVLQKAVSQLGPDGVDWQSAAKRDLESLRGSYGRDSQASVALTKIILSYVSALNDPSKLPMLQGAVESAPNQLSEVIPNPKRVLEEKQELVDKLREIRSRLQ